MHASLRARVGLWRMVMKKRLAPSLSASTVLVILTRLTLHSNGRNSKNLSSSTAQTSAGGTSASSSPRRMPGGGVSRLRSLLRIPLYADSTCSPHGGVHGCFRTGKNHDCNSYRELTQSCSSLATVWDTSTRRFSSSLATAQ